VPAPTILQSKLESRREEAEETLHLTLMAPSLFETYVLRPGSSVRIGRDEQAEVRMTDELASRLHARLHVDTTSGLTIEDLGSQNGTFVRGARIEPRRPVGLNLGETFNVGYTHLMVQRRRQLPQSRRFHGHGVFEEKLEDACERASRTGTPHAVVRVQVAGETTPGQGVEAMTGAFRPGDFIAQYAPGDYELLLLDTDPARAREIAEEAQRRMRASGFEARAVVATYPADGRTAWALIGHTTALLRGDGAGGARDPVLKAESMRQLYRLADRAANGHAAAGLINILILGETGTGKEILADWIHRHSPRARGPFICINCAALTDSLLESELFGYEKGAFTGATQSKPGLLEAAAGGSVFLDEVGEMPLPLQTKLLRALENRQVTRVGALSPRPIDARFIAATNRDLEAEVAAQRFRQDLYFRLNGISLTLPPLRERTDEIEPLARRFLAEASGAGKRRPPHLTAEALDILGRYAWPGNIRELRNTIERALVLAEGNEIAPEHLPVEKLRAARAAATAPAVSTPEQFAARSPSDSGSAPGGPGSGLSPEAEAERRRIVETLAAAGGNQSRTAEALGMSRGTLIERLKRYGIRRPHAPRT